MHFANLFDTSARTSRSDWCPESTVGYRVRAFVQLLRVFGVKYAEQAGV